MINEVERSITARESVGVRTVIDLARSTERFQLQILKRPERKEDDIPTQK